VKRGLKKVFLFVGLTFLVNWLLFYAFLACGGRLISINGRILLIAYMFVPAAVVVFVQKLIYKEPVLKPFAVSFRLNRWFLIAWLLPLGISLAAIFTSVMFTDVQFTSDASSSRFIQHIARIADGELSEQLEAQISNIPVHPFWLGLASGLIAGLTINAIAGFGEELGWRGLMQRELAYIGFWKSSLVIGVIWGLWHIPIVLKGHNYPEHPVIGTLMMILLMMLLAPIFAFVSIRAGSVIAAAIIHGSFNAMAGLTLVVIKGGNDLTVGVSGLAGMIVLAAVNLFIFVYEKYFAKIPVAGYIFANRA
jgi:membrane protease YdiL (CAAX protease family)